MLFSYTYTLTFFISLDNTRCFHDRSMRDTYLMYRMLGCIMKLYPVYYTFLRTFECGFLVILLVAQLSFPCNWATNGRLTHINNGVWGVTYCYILCVRQIFREEFTGAQNLWTENNKISEHATLNAFSILFLVYLKLIFFKLILSD